MSLCTYGLLACSAFPAQPCELKLLHAAIKGGKVSKAGGSCVCVSCTCLPGHLHHHHAPHLLSAARRHAAGMRHRQAMKDAAPGAALP
jgi:hypothetical protein